MELADVILMTDFKFQTAVFQCTGIHLRNSQAENGRVAGRWFIQNIRRLSVEVSRIESEFVVKECRFKTKVHGVCTFPFQGRVYKGSYRSTLGIDTSKDISFVFLLKYKLTGKDSYQYYCYPIHRMKLQFQVVDK